MKKPFNDIQPSHAATLLDDSAVAEVLRLAPATIRGQRFRRRKGLPHWLTIDPIYVGTRARYRQEELAEWLLERGRDAPDGGSHVA